MLLIASLLPFACTEGEPYDNATVPEACATADQRLVSDREARTFAIAISIAILPTLLLLGRAVWHRLRRGEDTGSSVRVSGFANSIDVRRRLRAVRKSAAGRRLRVSFVMGQAGWTLTVISLSPTIMSLVNLPIGSTVGAWRWWAVTKPLGLGLLLFALFPTDARAIRIVCAFVIVIAAGLGLLLISSSVADPVQNAIGLAFAALCFGAAAVLAPTLRCRGSRAMQPRPALRRAWTAVRLVWLGSGVILAGILVVDSVQASSTNLDIVSVVTSTIALLCAALTTPRNRGRLHRRLGRLGGRGTEAEEAVAVAALVGGGDPDAALQRASAFFRCLPASQLHAADLEYNTTTPPAGPTLHDRTKPAAMGEMTAFLSHSWSDEKEAPGAKHAVVSHWATRYQARTGKEPTRAGANICKIEIISHCTVHAHARAAHTIHAPRLTPQDKACIDQVNIDQALACLPIFLAGCQTILVVAGTTYCSRLWCVIELFTFVRSAHLLFEH